MWLFNAFEKMSNFSICLKCANKRQKNCLEPLDKNCYRMHTFHQNWSKSIKLTKINFLPSNNFEELSSILEIKTL